MINKYPLWKHTLIVVVLGVGLLFALPNLFGEDPAVQISPARGASVDAALESRISGRLSQLGIPPKQIERNERSVLVRFSDTDEQLEAQDALRDELGRQYVVALNLAPATPEWLSGVGALPMYLGLDLRGGVHFLMEVDMAGAVGKAEERYVGDIRTLLREEKIRYKAITRRPPQGIVVTLRSEADREAANSAIRGEFPELDVEERDTDGDAALRVAMNEQAAREVRRFAVHQNITTLRNRVNELGVAEPVIQQQGENRIVVQLPGVQDTARAKEILGATATLEFRMVHTDHSVQDALAGRVPPGAKLYQERDGRPILLKRNVMLTGDYITDAASGIDQSNGSPAVFITLDGKGARLFSKRTRDQIGRPMAVVFIENKSETKLVDGKEVKERWTVEEVI
ncbi:MAG: protein translocase subunit SecD, partial [Gammaproteobacteria bacterium]|nr:protein translocase subunit SecD [Gammaproteobacteria bacterium]